MVLPLIKLPSIPRKDFSARLGNFLLQIDCISYKPWTRIFNLTTTIMGVPSTQASNALIYVTYAAFLFVCPGLVAVIRVSNVGVQFIVLRGATLHGDFGIRRRRNGFRVIRHKRVSSNLPMLYWRFLYAFISRF